jgi:hypothetical protein
LKILKQFGNALSAMIKRKQLTEEEALNAQTTANKIPVRLVNVDIQSALKLAIEFKKIIGTDHY